MRFSVVGCANAVKLSTAVKKTRYVTAAGFLLKIHNWLTPALDQKLWRKPME